MWLLSRTYLDGYKRSNLFKKKNAQFNFPKKKKKVVTCLFKLLKNTHLIFSYML